MRTIMQRNNAMRGPQAANPSRQARMDPKMRMSSDFGMSQAGMSNPTRGSTNVWGGIGSSGSRNSQPKIALKSFESKSKILGNLFASEL
jgi:hypothetical protein